MMETPDSVTGAGPHTVSSPSAAGPIDGSEYVTQFLGFAPNLFANGIYNAMKGYTWDCLHAIHLYIREEFEGKVSEEELVHGQNKVETAMCDRIDAVIDKLEMFLTDNIFKIPAHVLLPEDRIQEQQPCTADEEAEIDREIEELKYKILCGKYASARYREAMDDMEKTQEEISQVLQGLQALQKVQRAGGVENLEEYAKFLTTNLLGLHSVVEKLQSQELPRKEQSDREVQKKVDEIMAEFRREPEIMQQSDSVDACEDMSVDVNCVADEMDAS